MDILANAMTVVAVRTSNHNTQSTCSAPALTHFYLIEVCILYISGTENVTATVVECAVTANTSY
jgi:hypothetical protein